MAEADDDEIDALRRRAYGPNADIQRDPQALWRLRELEGKGISRGEATQGAHEGTSLTGRAVEPTAWDDDASQSVLPASRFRIGRSTVLVMMILGTILAVVVAALLLVQRVQTDPLQAGATQIGRLDSDAGYRVPNVFGGQGELNGFAVSNAGGKRDAHGYQEFHGFRAVIDGSKSPCLTVYRAADVADPASDSFSGTAFSGCAAGRFPAVVQFSLDGSIPANIRATLPHKSALQFVFDESQNQIVVFATE